MSRSAGAARGEFALIERFKPFQNLTSRVVRGIGDDTAVLALDRRRYQLFTADMLVEGVHFRRSDPPRLVGRKSLACSISDIAAMAGTPTAAVVSLGLPRRLEERYVLDLYAGMRLLARTFGVSIVGGDTVRAERLVINVALLGEVLRRDLVTRAGARPGDVVCVTGPLGGSLRSGRHLSFTPRVKEARWLAARVRPSAMMDLSDGLAGDIRHILAASGVGAELDAERVPRHRGVSLEQALSDGEDFELLFTASPARAARSSFPVIGRIINGEGRLLIRQGTGPAVTLRAGGFQHF